MAMRRITCAVLLLCGIAAAGKFTLEQVLSAAFPSELVAAPGGTKVAWLLNERGARNVWVAVTALRQQGVYFEQLILPDEIHGFSRHGSWLKAYHATADFFGRKL